MKRREALKTAGAVAGAVLLTVYGTGACSAERQAENNASSGVLNSDEQTLIESIADTIFPTTAASPGAKAAGAGPAINLLLTDCYTKSSQERVVAGLAAFRATCKTRTGREFGALASDERERLLRDVDREAQKAGDAHYFGLVRELSHRAYFSSQVGMTRAMRYVQTPGRWIGCVSRSAGEPAWA